MRKIWLSSNTSWIEAFRATALARSVPNGFSMMMRESLTRSAASRVLTTSRAALGGTLR